MEIEIVKVKQYNSTFKYILMANGVPACITDSYKRASVLGAYLNGYEVELNDGSVKKVLDRLKEGVK